MPECRHCHEQIDKFETDICPYCGGKNPIPDTYKTMDITKPITKMNGEKFVLYKSKSQKVYVILCMLLGFSGAHNFYIKKPKYGLVDIIISVVVIAGFGSVLTFATPLSFFGYLVAFCIAWFMFFVYSFYLRRKDSPRDGDGEFLR